MFPQLTAIRGYSSQRQLYGQKQNFSTEKLNNIAVAKQLQYLDKAQFLNCKRFVDIPTVFRLQILRQKRKLPTEKIKLHDR